MLIVTAVNITSPKRGVLSRRDGTADYRVEVAINHAPPIWAGQIHGHIRKEGAAKLLRLIADKMETNDDRDSKHERSQIRRKRKQP